MSRSQLVLELSKVSGRHWGEGARNRNKIQVVHCSQVRKPNSGPLGRTAEKCFVNLQYSSVRYCRPGALIGNGPKIVGKKMNGKNGWKKALKILVGLSDCIAWSDMAIWGNPEVKRIRSACSMSEVQQLGNHWSATFAVSSLNGLTLEKICSTDDAALACLKHVNSFFLYGMLVNLLTCSWERWDLNR